MRQPLPPFQWVAQTTPPRLSLQGSFDLSAIEDFRQAYRSLLASTQDTELILDLSELTFIDSSALGSLLQLRHEALQQQCCVRLENCHGPVESVLRIANFGKLFPVHQRP
jgi:anti-anti-sigma factor